MLDPSTDLPEVQPRDPEPVAVAIETARALYRSGEQFEALRWLRRAAERAEESGDDIRAVHLARSAADLSTALQSLPPSALPPPPPPPAPTPTPPTHRRNEEAPALTPYDDFSDKTIVDAASPAAPRESQPSGVHITELPESLPVPQSVTMPSPPSSTPMLTQPQFVPVLEVTVPAVRPALRVAVQRGSATAGGYVVRPLAEGSPVPPGFEEALLIALNPRSSLLG